MDKNIGKRLDGRYEIRELIGTGGMSDVYKAYDIAEQNVVAVKILKREFAENEEFLRRFRNESKAIALLSHKNIVKIIDVGFTNRIQFIVMEYIEGITLKDYMEREKILDRKKAAFFTIQILKALKHAHERGVVHRDIKPQNIMLCPDETIKVMDFGIAKFAREEGLTTTAQAIGSVHYISPEQARSSATDEKSDIYSVGIVMYEMLTGKKPFDNENPVSIALMQMQTKARRPRRLNPDIPKGLEEIVLKAIEKDPENRYQTAVEMINDIERFNGSPEITFGYYYEEEEKSMENDNRKDNNTEYYKPSAPAEKVTRIKAKPKKPEPEIIGEDDDIYDTEYVERRSLFIPILSGVVIVVVIIAVCFVFGMVYDAIGGDKSDYAEFDLENYVGSDYTYTKEKYLSQLNFIVENEQYSSVAPKGQILTQEPEAGKRVKPGSDVKVTISRGKEKKPVTSVDSGFSIDQAKEQLTEAGFAVQVKYRYSDIEKDHVVSTYPAANELIETGSTVIIYASRGPVKTMVAVPDLVGKKEKEAKDTLEDIDLVVNIVVIDSEKPQGIVAIQSNSNQKMQTGETVTLYVSSGKLPTVTHEIPIQFPQNASGEFVIDAYLDAQLNSSKEITAEFGTMTNVQITAQGGEKEIILKLRNKANNKEAVLGRYLFSFDEIKTKKTLEENFLKAFEEVDGIHAAPVTTPAVTTAVTTASSQQQQPQASESPQENNNDQDQNQDHDDAENDDE